MRDHYTKNAPHVVTLTVLDKTPRSAPAPEEGREADRVPQEAEPQELGVREEGCHPHPLRAVHPGELRRPCTPFKMNVTITNLSLAVRMVSLRDLELTIPGGPLLSVHWSALLRTE